MKLLQLTTLGLLLLSLNVTVQAQIYKWTDENGNVHYSQTPPPDNKAENIAQEIEMAAGTASASDKEDSGEKEEEAGEDEELSKARKQGEEKKLEHRSFCERQKGGLKQLLANPVIRSKVDGEEKILTADERSNKITEVKNTIKKLCKPEILNKKQMGTK